MTKVRVRDIGLRARLDRFLSPSREPGPKIVGAVVQGDSIEITCEPLIEPNTPSRINVPNVLRVYRSYPSGSIDPFFTKDSSHPVFVERPQWMTYLPDGRPTPSLHLSDARSVKINIPSLPGIYAIAQGESYTSPKRIVVEN